MKNTVTMYPPIPQAHPEPLLQVVSLAAPQRIR